VQEVRKLSDFSGLALTASHYRTSDGYEVDLLLERSDGRVVGIEVKASASLDVRGFRGLNVLADATRDRFCCGVVLYLGGKVLSYGKRMAAVPIGALWQGVEVCAPRPKP